MTGGAVLAGAYAPASGGSDSFTLSGSLSTTTLSGTAATSSITTSSSVTVTPHGGAGTINYQWLEAWNADNIVPTDPQSATTSFRRNGCISGDIYTASFFCALTDEIGGYATTEEVSIQITRT